MTKKTYGGVPGSAVLFGTAGLYLVYIGIKNVPFFEGLRSLLRQQRPTPKTTSTSGISAGKIGHIFEGDKGTDKLVGYAKNAYPVFRQLFPKLTIYGWRSVGSVPNSDHPKGKALDIMNPTSGQANAIIITFMGLPGATYWIWNRERAARNKGWKVEKYLGPSPHLDHVHLSFE